MASAEFDDTSEQKRPTVQVGDPFTEKLLLEACLELMEHDFIVGIQDMGAAGLTSSSFEMAGRAGTGIRMHLDRVPLRESGMTPYEIMLSESQERMLIVARKGREQDVISIFEKWDLDVAVIGEVSDDGFVRLVWNDEEVAVIPVEPISTEAPVYERPIQRPGYLEQVQSEYVREVSPDGDRTADLLSLLATPNLSSKRWIYRQYDTTVRTNTLARSEQSDAAVLRVKGTGRSLAITSDVNPVYCYLDPYEGGKQAVAEAARNIAASGGVPVAITDCLNFGSPERPETMWQFAECIRGISDACLALGTPVVSGNVSFYNETEGRGIYPTPTVGMVGIVEPETAMTTLSFRRAGDAVVILGTTLDELGGSEYLQLIAPEQLVRPPRVNLEIEKSLIELLAALRGERLTHSVHDLANGGLAIALAECAMDGVGCELELGGHADELDAVALLFSESQGRAIISCSPEEVGAVLRLAAKRRVPAFEAGRTSDAVFLIRRQGEILVRSTVPELHRIWSTAFAVLLSGDSIEDVIRGRGEIEDVIV